MKDIMRIYREKDPRVGFLYQNDLNDLQVVANIPSSFFVEGNLPKLPIEGSLLSMWRDQNGEYAGRKMLEIFNVGKKEESDVEFYTLEFRYFTEEYIKKALLI